jgi:RNA polymerase sigma-70 factor (ECF subfamily)
VRIPDPASAHAANTITANRSDPNLTDRDELAAFRNGDRDALGRVYRRHVADVVAFLRTGFMYTTNDQPTRFQGVADSLELESLVQEVFARAFEPRTRLAYDGLRPYSAFLNGIARHLVLDRLRKQARRGEILASPDQLDATVGEPPDVEATADEKRGRELVARFLETECDERDRTLYALRYERDLSQVDAARGAKLTRIQVRRWETKFRGRLLRFLMRADYVRER